MTDNYHLLSCHAPETQQTSTLSKTSSTLVPSNQPASKGMKYYDLTKNWHCVRPHLGDKKLNDILVRDFNKFTFGRWKQKFTHGAISSLNPATGISSIGENAGLLELCQTRRLSLADQLQSPFGNAGQAKEAMENHNIGKTFHRLGWRQHPL